MSGAPVSAQMHEEIFALAKTLCNCKSEEEAPLERLCIASEEELAAQLRAGISVGTCESAFICAAAWLAVAVLESGRGTGDVESVRAGAMSVKAAGANRRAERCELLRRSARALMAPYCREENFCFRGVQG